MRAAREAAGIRQAELARRAGLPKMTLSRLERDAHQGCISTIELLADALGLSIDEYIGHEKRRGKQT